MTKFTKWPGYNHLVGVYSVFMALTLWPTDSVSQWIVSSFKANDMSMYSVEFATNDVGFIGGRNKIIKTTNGGLLWDTVYSSGGLVFFDDIQFFSEQNGYALGASLLKTIDGGNTWVSKNVSGRAMFFFDKDRGYVVGNNAEVYSTIDGGDNWTTKQIGVEYLSDIYFSSDSVGYVVGGGGTIPNIYGSIFKTTDGGSTWVQKGNAPWFLTCVDFPTAQTGYAFSNTGIMLKSIDAGETWLDIEFPNEFGMWDCLFLNTDTGYAAGVNWSSCSQEGAVIKTVDGRITWKQEFETCNYYSLDMQDLELIGTSLYAVGGTSHALIAKTEILNFTPDKSIRAYPNPISNLLSINLWPTKDPLIVRIHNSLGQIVYSAEITPDVRYKIDIDVSHLNHGVYHLNVLNGSEMMLGSSVIKL